MDGFEVVFGPQTSWKVENTLETGCAKLGCTLITPRTPPSRVPPQGVHSVPDHSTRSPTSPRLSGRSSICIRLSGCDLVPFLQFPAQSGAMILRANFGPIILVSILFLSGFPQFQVVFTAKMRLVGLFPDACNGDVTC